MALPRLQWPLAFDKQEPDFDPPGVIPGKLPKAIDNIGWAFTWGCVGFLLYFTWSAAGDKAVALEINQFLWLQNIGLRLWLPLVVPYTIISVAVPILVKFGLPMFMEFDDKKPRQGWPKWWSAVLVVGGSLVIIAGSFVVQNDARLEQNRTGAVQVQQAAANKAAIDAQIAELRSQLSILMEDGQARPTIEGKAAREGAAGWSAKVAEAEAQYKAGQPVDVNRIRRAQSAAVAADGLRDKITAKIGEKAAMPTEAAVADRVVKEGDKATAFVDFVKEWRSLLLALISDLGALFCTWLAMRLTDIRAQQLADWEAVNAAPAPDAGIDLRITDGTGQWQPMPQETTYDENGNELVPVRRKKEVYYRRKGGKKKDGAQAPVNPSDPRAPAANEVELGDDAEKFSAEAAVSGDVPRADLHADDGDDLGAGEPNSGGIFGSDHSDIPAADDSDLGDSAAADMAYLEETHAAHESSFEGQGQDEVDEGGEAREAEEPLDDAIHQEAINPGIRDFADGEDSGRSEDHDAEALSATPLPNGEGVLLYTEDEIAELERQWAARKGLPAPEVAE